MKTPVRREQNSRAVRTSHTAVSDSAPAGGTTKPKAKSLKPKD
jgi:hypothetical protein